MEDCCQLVSTGSSSLSIMTQNIRSINCNFSGFEILLKRLKINVDIIILTECWLSHAAVIPCLQDYKMFSTLNNPLQNDGVVTYIKKEIMSTVEEPPIMDANSLLIKLGLDTAILAIYRSPSYISLDQFLTSLEQCLHKISQFKNMAVIGDINIAINEDKPHRNIDQYLNLAAFHSLLPSHSYVTRDASGTCIDHVLLKTKHSATTLVIQASLTDHKPVLLCLRKKHIRDYATISITKTNFDQLQKDIASLDFTPIYESLDPEFSTNYIIESVTIVIKKNTQMIPLARRKKIIKPWITPGLLRCMRNRDKLHAKLRKSPNNEVLKVAYSRYRNFCNALLRKIKRAFEREQITNAGNDSRKIWQAIKNITNTAKVKQSSQELLKLAPTPDKSLDEINNCFANVGKLLAENILRDNRNTGNGNSFYSQPFKNSFVLTETDPKEVNSLIMSLKNNCAVGWDKISNRLLKEFRGILVPPLTYLFNQCFRVGVFPTALKRSVIVPVYKAGERDRISNYRPISLLSSVSKILEKLINTRLINYLEKHKLLSDSQFGFRRARSTSDAVHAVTDFVATNLDEGRKCMAVFLDLAKAFDTVSVTILLRKLEAMGVRGNQLNLFESYLSNRNQVTTINGYFSTESPVTFGVPQGSVLGPTLFVIYLNDLCSYKPSKGRIISYADDTVILLSDNSWQEVFNAAQIAFNTVSKWLTDNVLTLNTDKTKYMTFSIRNSGRPKDDFHLVAHNCKLFDPGRCSCNRLQRTDHIKYLGVTLDSHLNFSKHFALLSGRIRKLMPVFKTLRHIAEAKLVRQIYYALCQSLISYCITSWGGAPATTIKCVEVAQRAILKISTFRPFLFPTKLLYQKCEVLTVRQLFILGIILKQHGLVSFDPRKNMYRRRGRVCESTKQFHTSFIQRFFCFLGPFVFNKVNKVIPIYSLNRNMCKKAVTAWLQNLGYEDTEKILAVLR